MIQVSALVFFAVGLAVLVGGEVMYAWITPAFAQAAGVIINR